MGVDDEYWVPEHVRAYLRGLGFVLPLEPMEEHIREWNEWMRSEGSFYDYYDADGRAADVGRGRMHRAAPTMPRSVSPGASLLWGPFRALW